MLVLTRKTNESVNITGPCTVTVVEVSRGKVRLGFEAAADVAIVRSEIDDGRAFRREPTKEEPR